MLQGSDGWRNRLASRFRKSNSDQYDLEEAEAAEGLELRDYLSEISAPKTEPTRRRPMNIEDNSSDKAAAARKEKRERTKSRIEGDQVGSSFILSKVIVASTRWKLAEVVGRVPTSFPGIMTPNSLTESM